MPNWWPKPGKMAGDFIKIMISGLMDFDHYGVLTEPGLDEREIAQLIRIAHEEGFAVMAHANGARTVEAAAASGVDSVEHGAYLDEKALRAMARSGTVWCPTVSTVLNLRHRGRFDDRAVEQIGSSAAENIRRFVQMGGLLAPGSDAGAWAVPHGRGSEDEYRHLREILGIAAEAALAAGAEAIRAKF